MSKKVLVLSGSPNQNGCTNAALTEVVRILNKEGIVKKWAKKQGSHCQSVSRPWLQIL